MSSSSGSVSTIALAQSSSSDQVVDSDSGSTSASGSTSGSDSTSSGLSDSETTAPPVSGPQSRIHAITSLVHRDRGNNNNGPKPREPQHNDREIDVEAAVHVPTRPPFYKRHPKAIISVSIALAVITFISLAIMLPLSFQYVELDEWAYKKNNFKNHVDTSKAYGNGRYFWGLGYTTVPFDRTYQHINFWGNRGIRVFTANGLELKLEVTFQYRIKPEAMRLVYEKFGLVYHSQVVNVASARLLNTAPTFAAEDYITDWERVSNTFASDLGQALASLGFEMPIRKFQLREIILPPKIAEKYEHAAIRLQDNIRKVAEQEASLIRKETERQVEEIHAQVQEINWKLNATRDRIIDTAQAESFRLVQEAHGEGFKTLVDALQVSNPVEQKRLWTLLAAIDSSSADSSVTVLSGVNANAILNT